MRLTHQESVVIRLRFGLGTEEMLTYKEIATVVGISETMVRHLETRALRKLRHTQNRKQMQEIAETVAILPVREKYF